MQTDLPRRRSELVIIEGTSLQTGFLEIKPWGGSTKGWGYLQASSIWKWPSRNS